MDASEFTDEQVEALQALADGYNDQSVSRRDVLKLAGAGGIGALLGGGGAASAVGQASAGTAQSGQLGAIGDPLDLVVEDLKDGQGNTVASANAGALEGTSLQYESVNADELNNKRIVRSGGDYPTIQAAHDDLPDDGGLIIMATAVSETQPTLTKPVTLIGGGMGDTRNPTSGPTQDPPDIHLDHSGGNGLNVDGDGVEVYQLCCFGDGANGSYGVRVAGRGQTVQARSTRSGGDGWLVQERVQNSRYDTLVDNPTTNSVHIDVTATDAYCNGNKWDRVMASNGSGDGIYINGAATGNEVKGNEFRGFVCESVGGYGIRSDDFANHNDNLFTGYGVEAAGTGKLDISQDNEWRFTLSNGAVNSKPALDSLPSGSTIGTYRMGDQSAASGEDRIRYTTGVSTTTTPIMTGLVDGGLFVVKGELQSGDGSTAFTDVVSANRNGSANVIDKNGRASADARTYSMSGGDIELVMGANTYDIVCKGSNLRAVSG